MPGTAEEIKSKPLRRLHLVVAGFGLSCSSMLGSLHERTASGLMESCRRHQPEAWSRRFKSLCRFVDDVGVEPFARPLRRSIVVRPDCAAVLGAPC